jgi:hypothetical protein
LPGLEQSFAETSQQQTDLQGSFTFEAVPFLIDGASLLECCWSYRRRETVPSNKA